MKGVWEKPRTNLKKGTTAGRKRGIPKTLQDGTLRRKNGGLPFRENGIHRTQEGPANVKKERKINVGLERQERKGTQLSYEKG